MDDGTVRGRQIKHVIATGEKLDEVSTVSFSFTCVMEGTCEMKKRRSAHSTAHCIRAFIRLCSFAGNADSTHYGESRGEGRYWRFSTGNRLP